MVALARGRRCHFPALAVNDPSLRPNAIPEKSDQHASSRLPALQRGDAYASRTRVLSERHFLRHRFAWARKLCCQSLRDTPFGSTVGSTGWNGRSHEPWKPPGPAGCPERRLALPMGFTTPKINRVSTVKWTG